MKASESRRPSLKPAPTPLGSADMNRRKFLHRIALRPFLASTSAFSTAITDQLRPSDDAATARLVRTPGPSSPCAFAQPRKTPVGLFGRPSPAVIRLVFEGTGISVGETRPACSSSCRGDCLIRARPLDQLRSGARPSISTSSIRLVIEQRLRAH